MKVTILNIIGTYKPCITIGKLVPVRSHMAYLVPVSLYLSLFMRNVSLASQLNNELAWAIK